MFRKKFCILIEWENLATAPNVVQGKAIRHKNKACLNPLQVR
jgi:hypothetical protein